MNGGQCVCDKGWTGPTCGKLDVSAEAIVAYGYGASPESSTQSSSWGGGPPVYDPLTEQYHLFVTELAGHWYVACAGRSNFSASFSSKCDLAWNRSSCSGMGVWARMSQAAHGVSKSKAGPFERVGVAVPTQTHNVYYAYSPTDQVHLIYSIFSGTSPEACNPYFKGCTNGSTPGTQGGVRPRRWSPPSTCKGEGGAHVHWSKSLNGPWTSHGPLKTNTNGYEYPGSSNPAPYIFPNGTVLMIGTTHR